MDIGRIRAEPAEAGGKLSRGLPQPWFAALWHRRWLRTFAIAAIVAGLFCLSYFTSGWWLPAAGHWLDVGQTPRPCDYCLVLSGDYESRPFAAAALCRRGFVRDQIWLTHTGLPDTTADDSKESNDRARLILATLGIPASRVLELPGTCSSTFDEAVVLAQAMALHPAATVNVVTSNYHTRRARWIIRRTLGAAADRVRYVSVPTDYYDAGCWWKVETGFTTYTKEFSKNVFYLLWYGWGGVWIAGIAAAVTLYFIFLRARKKRSASPAALQ